MRAADPLSILDQSEDNLQETIGWFRHAEIKHGRVAMAAFVGYCVQANNIYFPWKLTGGPNPIMHADISAAGSPADQWDALPFEAKCQIIVCHTGLEPQKSRSQAARPQRPRPAPRRPLPPAEPAPRQRHQRRQPAPPHRRWRRRRPSSYSTHTREPRLVQGAIGTFELIGEYSEILQMNGEKHYVRGGKPGYYPPFEVPPLPYCSTLLPIAPYYPPLGPSRCAAENNSKASQML